MSAQSVFSRIKQVMVAEPLSVAESLPTPLAFGPMKVNQPTHHLKQAATGLAVVILVAMTSLTGVSFLQSGAASEQQAQASMRQVPQIRVLKPVKTSNNLQVVTIDFDTSQAPAGTRVSLLKATIEIDQLIQVTSNQPELKTKNGLSITYLAPTEKIILNQPPFQG